MQRIMPIRISIRECFGSNGSINGREPNICSVRFFISHAEIVFQAVLAARSPIELISFVTAKPAKLNLTLWCPATGHWLFPVAYGQWSQMACSICRHFTCMPAASCLINQRYCIYAGWPVNSRWSNACHTLFYQHGTKKMHLWLFAQI